MFHQGISIEKEPATHRMVAPYPPNNFAGEDVMTQICRRCKKYRTPDCPKCEFKDSTLNFAACLPTDKICDQFEPKYEMDVFFATTAKGERGRFIPQRLGNAIMEEKRFISLSEKSDLYFYDEEEGVWKPRGIEVIEKVSTELLGDEYNPNRVNAVVKYIQFKNYINPNPFDDSPAHKVVMQNGVYNLEKDEFTKDFDPELHALAAISVTYDPEATCPQIEKFLGEIVGEKDVPKLKEFPGYCLYKRYLIHRALILEGPGENGKTTYLNLLESFLGKKNVSSVTFQKLAEGGFRSAEVHGKLANICGDIPGRPLKDTGFFKMLTGEDIITAEKKHRDPFQFTNYAKMVFSTNKVPPTWDDTIAYHRRIVIIPFPNSFPRGDPKTDIHILEKITNPEELSGFFNLAVKNLKIFLEQKGFSNELTTEERKIIYMRKSNPIQYFAKIFVEKDIYSWISKADLYNHYVTLCEKMKTTPRANNTFSSQIRRYLPYTDERKIKVDNERTKVWYGIKVKLKELEAFSTPQSNLEDFPTSKRHGGPDGHGILPLPQISKNQNLDKSENTRPTVPTVPETEPTTCWICYRPLPTDLKNCTTEEGGSCHIECSKKYKAGRNLNITSIVPLGKDSRLGTCFLCKKMETLSWQITNAQDERADVCGPCIFIHSCEVKIPFMADFKDSMLGDTKTWTSRTKRYGKPGDIFPAFNQTFILLAVERHTLKDIAENHWREEGCTNQEHFQTVWKKLHKKKGWQPDQLVHVHIFMRKQK